MKAIYNGNQLPERRGEVVTLIGKKRFSNIIVFSDKKAYVRYRLFKDYYI